jgi:hypothetical protein
MDVRDELYSRVRQAGYDDISACPHGRHYKIADEKSQLMYGDPPRLGHSHSLQRTDLGCFEMNEIDTIHCFYLFGDTLIIQKHQYGKCPWKLL